MPETNCSCAAAGSRIRARGRRLRAGAETGSSNGAAGPELGFDQRLGDDVLGIERGEAPRRGSPVRGCCPARNSGAAARSPPVRGSSAAALRRRRAGRSGAPGRECPRCARASGGRRSGTTLRRKNRSSRNSALLDRVAQVLVGRGDDAHVGLDRRAAADRGVFALLQHAQQAGLRLHRHVADLVEKQRAALGLLEAADRARVGAGEGALLVAEQLALDQIARDRGHVDGDERARSCACRSRAARARPAPCRCPTRRKSSPSGRSASAAPASGRCPASPASGRPAASSRRGAASAASSRAAFGLRKRAADDRHQLLQVERLGQIFVGAALGGLDRGHEGVLRAHDDDRQIGPHALDARQQLEGVVVGHDDVGDDEVAFAGGDPAPRPATVPVARTS